MAQTNHCFQMKRLRKEIGEGHGFDRISLSEQRPQIVTAASERCTTTGVTACTELPVGPQATRHAPSAEAVTIKAASPNSSEVTGLRRRTLFQSARAAP